MSAMLEPDEIMAMAEDDVEVYTLPKEVWVHREHIDETNCIPSDAQWGRIFPEDAEYSCHYGYNFITDGDDIRNIKIDSQGIWWTGDERPRNDITMEICKVGYYPDLHDALIGTAHPWIDHERPTVLVYSYAKILDIYMERDGMTYEEAVEFVSFNTDGGYLGPRTPIIVYDA